MVTKYPLHGNQGATSGTRTGRPRGRRGVALVSVISVLVLLMIVATPFMLTMRDSARRGEAFLYDEAVTAEAESLFDWLQASYTKNLEHMERRRLDDGSIVAGASGAQVVPDDATPSSDTPGEFAIPAELLAEFNRTTGNEQRIWDAQVWDTQAKFNLNSCSIGVLANLLGRAELSDNITASDDRIGVSSVAGFPPKNGVVRIGAELVQYDTADASSSALLGCRRGHLSSKRENGPAAEHAKGEFVIHEAAFQIATRMFRARPGTWVRYTNVLEARSISELGVSALLPEEFDRIRRYLTAWNGNLVGDGWCNPQQVRTNIAAADQGTLSIDVKNVRYFGTGTIVRITDGVNEDYAVVVNVRGANQLELAGDIRHDYLADQTRIYSLARAPVNVNTADVDTLSVVFDGLGLTGKSSRITRDQAVRLAVWLRERKPPEDATGVVRPAGVYRGWQELVDALEEARDAQGILNADDFEAVLRNALNPGDSRLSFSTVPLTFRSFDVYEARATAAILGPQGDEIARRELTRVFQVATSRSSTFVLETQADFQEQIRLSRDAKWFVTYPVNVNAFYDKGNEPASEYQAFANENRYPDTDRSPGAGHAQMREAAFRFTGQGRPDRYHHFDEQKTPEGLDLEEESLEFSVDGPYDVDARKADLVQYAQVPQRSDATEIGLAPFSCSFWYQPKWEADDSEHVVFDYGLTEAAMNRVALRYVPDRKSLVLSVWDATREVRSCDIEFPLRDGPVEWVSGQWYHIACTVYGCSPEMMELFVDCEKVGRSPLLTRLTNQIPSTGDLQFVDVEDASGFPDSGVLVLRGADGIELIEYSQRDDRRFTVRRRKARTVDKVLDANNDPPRSHANGEVVQLYGFAAPLLTDIKKGGATLAQPLGPWRIYRARGSDTATYTTTGGQGRVLPNGIAQVSGNQPRIFLTEWTTGNASDPATLDDLGGVGSQGVAILASQVLDAGAQGDAVNVSGTSGSGTNSDVLGGIDVVLYRVETTSGSNGAEITLLQRGLRLRHWDAGYWVSTSVAGGGRYFPGYTYGDTSFPLTLQRNGQTLQYPGFWTAFIPIGVAGQGGSAEYLDPADQEPQLGTTNAQGAYSPGTAYVQIDSEWIKYDTFDNVLLPNQVVFYRDLVIPQIANLFGMGGTDVTTSTITPIVTASSARPGGSGQSGSNTEPPHAQDFNVESQAPAVPATGTQLGNTQAPPTTPDDFSMSALATLADFRSWEDRANSRSHRIANTIARSHASGAAVIPCFALYSGNEWDTSVMGRRAYAGFDDLVTLRDILGADEQIRIQWGWRNWAAPTQATVQAWNWDRPFDGTYVMRQYPSQAFTRALKFPSSEMPDQQLTANAEKIRFGRTFDGTGATTPAFVDEVGFQQLEFPSDDRRDWVFLGVVPAQLYTTSTPGTTTSPLRFGGIDDKSDTIPVFMPYYDPNIRGTIIQGLPIPAEVFRADGGVVRIDEELILYSGVDTEAGQLTGCLRGCFNTIAASHDYGAKVIPVECFPASRLVAEIDESTASFELMDTTDFPDDGYIRIADGLEVMGYTEIDGTRLTGPLTRIDPASAGTAPPPGSQAPGGQTKQVGGGLFRGRFATEPAGAAQGDVVIAMPWRHYDRYSERSDDPENSYTQFSWTRENAIWKRISWDELPVKNVEVLALVRFSGGPAWDSDKVIRVGQQTIPDAGRREWLYEISDPKAENLLNVEADRVEVRLMIRFARGAYDRGASPRPNEWKQTPWIQRVLVEYVAPSSVLSQE